MNSEGLELTTPGPNPLETDSSETKPRSTPSISIGIKVVVVDAHGLGYNEGSPIVRG